MMFDAPAGDSTRFIAFMFGVFGCACVARACAQALGGLRVCPPCATAHVRACISQGRGSGLLRGREGAEEPQPLR